MLALYLGMTGRCLRGRGILQIVAVIYTVGLDRIEGEALFDEITNGSSVGPQTRLAWAARIAGRRLLRSS